MCPISLGELIDKIAILKVKHEKIKDPVKQTNIQIELTELSDICPNIEGISHYVEKLGIVNSDLFNVLAKQRSDPDNFQVYAKQVILLNDQRFFLKQEINEKYNSHIKEEKYYEKWSV